MFKSLKIIFISLLAFLSAPVFSETVTIDYFEPIDKTVSVSGLYVSKGHYETGLQIGGWKGLVASEGGHFIKNQELLFFVGNPVGLDYSVEAMGQPLISGFRGVGQFNADIFYENKVVELLFNKYYSQIVDDISAAAMQIAIFELTGGVRKIEGMMGGFHYLAPYGEFFDKAQYWLDHLYDEESVESQYKIVRLTKNTNNYGSVFTFIPVSQVPLPASFWVFLSSLGWFGWRRVSIIK